MAKQLVFERHPVDEPFLITGRFLQVDGVWSPDHPHLGVDYGHPEGGGKLYRALVYAPCVAKVYAVHRPGDGWGNGSFGNCVVLDFEDTPWYGLYAHLDSVLVEAGDTVTQHTILGRVGYTGFVEPTGPAGAHLHNQVSTSASFPRDPAICADPLSFLRTAPVSDDVDAENDAVDERQDAELAALRRVAGGPEANNYDLLVNMQQQQTAFRRHLIEEHPDAPQTVEMLAREKAEVGE